MYVDAIQYGNHVMVAERDGGQRRIRKYKAPYYFYVETSEDRATHRSMFGHPLEKISFDNRKEFEETREENKLADVKMFESDIRVEYKLLESQYLDKPLPKLHVAIIDIEVDTKAKIGWARWENPYAPINAVSIHRSWIGDTITLALHPPTMTLIEARDALSEIPDTLVFGDEAELLEAFIELIQDADVTTGWNSTKFDMPYIVARIRIALGGEDYEDFVHELGREEIPGDTMQHLRRLCLFGMGPRKHRSMDEFGETNVTFSFPGRPHLDYLELYKKFVLEPRESYKLDNILKVELGQGKVKYEGTLEQLYANDYRLFIEYNRQDVNGLRDLDKKLALISIANEMAHQSCVFLSDATGSVSKIEQAITCELHKKKLIAPDKQAQESKVPIAGAFVYDPRQGLYNHVANFDVKSEYPSTIIMLNISPEVLVGQFEQTTTMQIITDYMKKHPKAKSAQIWKNFTGVAEYHDIVDGNMFANHTLVLTDGTRITKSGNEWKEFFEQGGLSLSANGTVFDLSREGIIPETLSKWFSERKEYQAKAKAMARKMEDFLSKFPIAEVAKKVVIEEEEEEEGSDDE